MVPGGLAAAARAMHAGVLGAMGLGQSHPPNVTVWVGVSQGRTEMGCVWMQAGRQKLWRCTGGRRRGESSGSLDPSAWPPPTGDGTPPSPSSPPCSNTQVSGLRCPSQACSARGCSVLTAMRGGVAAEAALLQTEAGAQVEAGGKEQRTAARGLTGFNADADSDSEVSSARDRVHEGGGGGWGARLEKVLGELVDDALASDPTLRLACSPLSNAPANDAPIQGLTPSVMLRPVPVPLLAPALTRMEQTSRERCLPRRRGGAEAKTRSGLRCSGSVSRSPRLPRGPLSVCWRLSRG